MDETKELLSRIILKEIIKAREQGESMHTAADEAAEKVLTTVEPSTLRLHHEMSVLLAQWRKDRASYPTDEDWRADIADKMLKLCIAELEVAVQRAFPPVEDVVYTRDQYTTTGEQVEPTTQR